MAWNNYQLPNNEGGNILKLKDGQSVKVRIIGEPFCYQSEYEGKTSVRYAVTLWNHTAEAAQMFMMSRHLMDDVLGLAQNEEDWGDPEKYDLTITRKGTELDTVYSVQPSPNKKELEKDKREKVEAIDLAEVLERLPSVQFAVPLSEVDKDFNEKAKNLKNVGKVFSTDEISDDFLK